MVRKHKAASMLLSMLLCLSLVFPMGITAFADTADTLIWNDGDVISESVSINSDMQITVNGTVTVSAPVTISAGTVTVSGGGTLLRADDNTGESMFEIRGGDVTFSDITLDGNHVAFSEFSTNHISAVDISGGSLVINDGTVIQNNVKEKSIYNSPGGAAICADGDAMITMNGGTLRSNTSHRRGGAVYLGGGAVFNMNGGSITGNQTSPESDSDSPYGGGGVYVRDAEMNVRGGSVTDNHALNYRACGGGIYNSSYGTTRITGGTISGNTAAVSGNGIYHSSKEGVSSVFELGGGADIEDDIYLSSDSAYKYSRITSALQSNIKFSVSSANYDRIIAEGYGYDLTYADMAKMQVTNSDLALGLKDNQIRLMQTLETYTLYFGYDANGGTGAPASKELTVTVGEPFPVEIIDFSTIPEKEGYIFLGWDTDRNAKTPTYPKDGEVQTITINDNTTLYAIWEKIPVYYEVTANAEEGGTASGGGAVAEGGSVTLTAAANEGYTFEGWYEGEAKVCDTAEFVVENVTADKTYTAKFAENQPEPTPTPAASHLFNTTIGTSLINKICEDDIFDLPADSINAVHFVDLADYDLTDIAWSDYSAAGDGSVKAWMDGTELYIGGYGKIIAGESLSYAFEDGYKIDSITGIEMLDTSAVTDMSYMFYYCGYNSGEFKLNLGDNFDTSNVTNMSHMFDSCGYYSTNFTLDLGDNFDTSNVRSMLYMFQSCGYESTEFELDLGRQFDTSNVEGMGSMFQNCGFSSPVFTLDLGNQFNTSNVTNMRSMFQNCGFSSRYSR